MRELESLEEHHPELIRPDSPRPTELGAAFRTDSWRCRTSAPMLSLANARDREELAGWNTRICKLLDQADLAQLAFATEPKDRWAGDESSL